jgi:hypothetical protein
MDHKIILHAEPGPLNNPRGHWPMHLQEEFEVNQFSGAVGNQLVFENEYCRVWHLLLPPGGFLTFHRHVLDYFWSSLSAGIARGYYEDGRIQDVIHYPGETRFFHHAEGEYFVHAVENVGNTELSFVTVEFLPGDNPPIPIPDHYRLVSPHPNDMR